MTVKLANEEIAPLINLLKKRLRYLEWAEDLPERIGKALAEGFLRMGRKEATEHE